MGVHAFLFFVFVKNAWMSDDAYISFRSVEQLIAGNGPRWNAFERMSAIMLAHLFRSPTRIVALVCRLGVEYGKAALFDAHRLSLIFGEFSGVNS